MNDLNSIRNIYIYIYLCLQHTKTHKPIEVITRRLATPGIDHPWWK